MITDLSSLAEWKTRAAAQPQGRTVLDLEADSLHRHQEKLCLIQYGDADGVDSENCKITMDSSRFCLTNRGLFVIIHAEEGVVGAIERGWIDMLGKPRFSLK